MSDYLAGRVEQACQELAATDTPITFPAIAQQAGISRATLYRRPELRALVEEHRQHAREALTLTGLAVQLDSSAPPWTRSPPKSATTRTNFARCAADPARPLPDNNHRRRS